MSSKLGTISCTRLPVLGRLCLRVRLRLALRRLPVLGTRLGPDVFSTVSRVLALKNSTVFSRVC